ncbi:MAG: LysM peptidoglycan-binding domain-containing M23 family metallopeptidase [Proteobacteria bacterium]|nr:LysM peptidoglycan-binding domain-containing M23 family metallopeptidase [Pseudomonadota bacterium]
MPMQVELSFARGWPRAIVAVMVAGALSACSSETSRFDANPFAARSHAARGEVTGTVPAAAAPVQRVDSQQLTQASGAPLPPPPPIGRPASVAAPPGSAGGGGGLGSYRSPQPGERIAAARPPRATSWNWDGGTAVTVRQGETVESLSRRHRVPGAAIVQANNLGAPATIYPGQRLVIPRLSGGTPALAPATLAGRAEPQFTGSIAAPSAPAAQGRDHVHVVAPGETLYAIARRYNKRVSDIALANRIAPHTMVKIGDQIVIPGAHSGTASAAARGPEKRAAAPAPTQKLAAADPQPSVRLASPTDQIKPENDPGKAVAEPAGGIPSFRWPVRGRVIAGYGVKINGQSNDGVNLAVPEGTAIRAAEDGVVAYSGSELKGYGNLILVRHSNGFVTAYAHASQIAVKRGDQVRRGQVIGRSGQSGNVTAPQLHFEIRKGSTPVDPMAHLPGA